MRKLVGSLVVAFGLIGVYGCPQEGGGEAPKAEGAAAPAAPAAEAAPAAPAAAPQ